MPTGSPGGDQGATVALAWLSQPVTVLALVALVINDHALKSAYPGPITGKLSDVAGLVLAPPLLAVGVALLVPQLSARAAAIVGVAGVGLGFVVVKSSAVGASTASALWSAVAVPSHIRADVADLLTLPALALAWWAWTRARRRPVARRLVRLARVLVVLPASVLAVAATSMIQYPQAVAVAQWRGAIVVGEIEVPHDEDASQWDWEKISEDGGRTWRWLQGDELRSVEAEVDRADAEQTQACVPDDPAVCYRVVPGHLRVEETHDGGATWVTSWEVDDESRDQRAKELRYLGDRAKNLSSHALHVQPVDTGYVVLVANGRDGYALRDEDGQWRRIGFGTIASTSGAAQEFGER